MPRAIWQGAISFGLVHIPVGLYSAEKRNELGFTMLDRRNFAPVGYQRINKENGQEVPWEEIVKGYEYEEGHHVVITEEDLKSANPDATQTVDIVDFVNAGEIPPLYLDTPYYLAPGKRGDKGYALLREVLRRTGRVGIARVVIRSRQHIAALLPVGPVLVLDLLRYADELRKADELDLPGDDLQKLGISERELEMAERLVEGMIEPWQPERYRDEYREDVMAMIDRKIATGETRAVPSEAAKAGPQGAEVIDMMALLKRSLDERGKGRPRPEKTAEAKVRDEPSERPARGKGKEKTGAAAPKGGKEGTRKRA